MFFKFLLCLGEDSPAIQTSNPMLGQGIEEARRRLQTNLGAAKPRPKGKSKPRQRSPAKSDTQDVDSSSEDGRVRIRSRSRRRSRSRSPRSGSSYCEYNWVMLEHYWPIDQRPAIPYKEYIHNNLYWRKITYQFIFPSCLLPSLYCFLWAGLH